MGNGILTDHVSNCYLMELLHSLPHILALMQQILDSLPSTQEIKSTLFSIGPYKAARPDGFDAKTVQENWEEFVTQLGPVVCNSVWDFFNINQMPSSIARSNLVIIPKSEDVAMVTHYRPISVCNLLYKIISKILSKRMCIKFPNSLCPRKRNCKKT